jgi:multiple sugar transport system substrate-binding protein
MSGRINRRTFLRLAGMAAAGAGLAACGGTPTATPAPKATQAAVPTAAPAATTPIKLSMWTMNYGPDSAVWVQMMNDIGKSFKDKTKIEVNVELCSWEVCRPKLLLINQGGEHPDCADQFWLWSNVGLGRGKYGPMPITEYKSELFPDLEKRFSMSAMQDGFYLNEFYGPVYRGDPRTLLYRNDMLKDVGLTKSPATWAELIEYAKVAQKTDKSGNVTTWGFSFGTDNTKPQQLVTYYWQAGGEFMTKDGKTATIDNDIMRQTLKWMYDAIWTHKVVSPDFMEQGFNPAEAFYSSQIAISGQAGIGDCNNLDKRFPELDGKWTWDVLAMGPKNRTSYYGAGYWGVVRGTKYPYECAKWIAYLSQDENLLRLAEYGGFMSPNKAVMASKFWTDRPWKLVLPKVMEDVHPSQHPSSAWSAMMVTTPGGVMYDFYYDALVKKENMDTVIKRTQQRMQTEMDKAAAQEKYNLSMV